MVEPEKQQEIEAHPLWPDYKATLEALRKVNQNKDYYLVEPLEKRLTSLSLKIAADLDLMSLNRPGDDNQAPE